MEDRAGVRDLKARLSRYLQRVKDGDTILITEHGRPVARLVPVKESPVDRLEALEQSGIVAWNGRKLRPIHPATRPSGGRSVAALIVEDRE
jgi:prevent-host-death family protein